MKSKTKNLKKGYILGKATPAPAKKAENKKEVTNHIARDKRNEAESRSRARRMRSMLKLGMKPELVQEMFADEQNRMILVLLNGQYTVQDGMRDKKVRHYDKATKNVSIKVTQVPNILRGFDAAKKYVEDNKFHFMSGSPNSIWVLSDKDHVDSVVEKLKILGRTSVTKPEKKAEKKPKDKKPTNNTEEVKKAAKTARKAAKKAYADMRPYYAALRKGGVSERIKKHNRTLADKIEAWLKERKDIEAKKVDKIEKHKRDHRQMSNIEMKANKRARKAAKHVAAQERRREAEKKRMEHNEAVRAKRAQKPAKPVQKKLNMAA